MVNLKAIYGEQIFNRKKSYRDVRTIPYIAIILFDVVLAWAIVRIFEINWDYAVIKVYGMLLLFEVLKDIFAFLLEFLKYRLVVKSVMAAEIKHYLAQFGGKVDWDEVATYDDFFLEAAFTKTLSPELRVLAAINYGLIVEFTTTSPKFDSRLYRLFDQIAREFLGNANNDRVEKV